jgi:hypothetical protein
VRFSKVPSGLNRRAGATSICVARSLDKSRYVLGQVERVPHGRRPTGICHAAAIAALGPSVWRALTRYGWAVGSRSTDFELKSAMTSASASGPTFTTPTKG